MEIKGSLVSKDKYEFFELAFSYIKLEKEIKEIDDIPKRIILFKKCEGECGLKLNSNVGKRFTDLKYTAYIEMPTGEIEFYGGYTFPSLRKNKIMLKEGYEEICNMRTIKHKSQYEYLYSLISKAKEKINNYYKLDKKYADYINKKSDIILENGEVGLVKPENMSGKVFSKLIQENNDNIKITTGIYGAYYNNPDYLIISNANHIINTYPAVKASNKKEALEKAEKVAGGDGSVENLSVSKIRDNIYQLSYYVFD